MTAMTPRTIPPALEASKVVQGPLRRLRAAQERLEVAQDNYAQVRLEVVTELVAQGLTYAQVAGLLGVSRSWVHQIVKGA